MRTLLPLLALSAALAPSGTLLAQGAPAVPTYTRPAMSVAIVAADVEASRDFYVGALGFVEAGGFPIDSAFGRASGLTGGAPFEVAIVKPLDDPGATEVKLVSFAADPPRSPGDGIQARRGAQYVTLYLADVAPVVERLRARGYAFEGETPLVLPDGRTFALVRDPDGVYVELIGDRAAGE